MSAGREEKVNGVRATQEAAGEPNNASCSFSADNVTLVQAIRENQEDKVELLVSPTNINEFTEEYFFHARITPLVLAAKLGRLNIVKLLLRKGADVNIVDSLGRTALRVACEEDNEKVVGALLHYGADPNKARSQSEVGPDHTCLGAAIKSRNISVLRKLIKGGAKVNLPEDKPSSSNQAGIKTVEGENFLHYALTHSNADIVQLLCSHGCEVNVGDENMETPLYRAVRQMNVDCAAVLLKCGADPNVVTEQGNTMNIAAATVPFSQDMLKLLVENGAQLNVAERVNRVPLALYLNNYNMNEDLSVVKYLVQHGTILNEPRLVNEVRLMLNRVGQFDVVKVAIEGGMNIHQQPWLRKFLESPPGRKYWYSSTAYDTEKEMEFREFAEPLLSAPFSLAKLCCFEIRNHLISLGSGDSIAKNIDKLPLPEVVRQFIFLEHL